MNASENSALQLAESVMQQAERLGAQEVTAAVSEGTSVNLTRRDGKVEQATEASSRRLSISLLVDDRYSSHSTSDLRPEPLAAFLKRAVDATRYLEPDPERALPDPALCGRGATEEALDHFDPAWKAYSPEDRGQLAEDLEGAMEALRDDTFISSTTYASDGHSFYAQVTNKGFADTSEGAWFALGNVVTLRDEGSRRPEGMAFYAARYLSDLPGVEGIARRALDRAQEAIGSGPTESGRYPMILANHAAGRILGMLSGPLSGGSIHYGRSCLADKLGESIGSSHLTLRDDPTIPRGLASTPWDGDLMKATPRTIIEDGVLKSHYIDTYYGRKLGRPATTGGRTNWIIPAGDVPWQEIAKAYPKAILVTSFLGGNANPLTGDFSYGVRGMLLENGVPTQPLSEMNVSGNLLEIFHKLAAVGDDPWTWSSTQSPTLIFEDVPFSGV